jgi:hypothetical protein
VKNQSASHFPKTASAYLAFLSIIIAVLAGYGELHATPAKDLVAAPRPEATTSSDELIWVRQDPPIININNDPTYWETTEPRFEGSYGEYTITETEIAYHERWVDHGNEWYDVTLKTVFDRPPIVLNPPLRYKIKATASHSGAHNTGSIGMQFWYSSPYGAIIEPEEVLGYYPFDAWWDGTFDKEWMINPPAIIGEGDTFELAAGWWNCPPCNVTWIYKAEPANAVPRLGVEVVQPTVKYRGEEVPPGETFFPETCPATNSQLAESYFCIDEIELMKPIANAYMDCVAENADQRLWTLLLVIDEEWAEKAIVLIYSYELVENCEYTGPESNANLLSQEDDYLLELALKEGAVQLHNEAGGQTVSVDTQLGTAVAAMQGAFLTAYNPDTNVATFRAYSTPLTLQPTSGPDLVLQPNQEVKLTSEGFGSVSELPHLYLPMLTR